MRNALILCLLASTTITSAALANDPQFTPRPLPDHVYAGGWEHFVGGGLASFDCNGDALPELYAAGGSNPAQLLHNTGALNFAADTPEALALTGVIGAYPLDIDSDGLTDLAILRVGPDMLMRGTGDCQFTPFDLGFESGDHWSTAFSATWETGQTLPTLAIGTYVDRSDPKGPFETCDDTLLYRPTGDGYGTPQRLSPGYCALSMLFSDWSRTGRADLRVSNDRHYYVKTGQEQMWAMEPTPRLYEAEEGWHPFSIWGMGIASRDLTGDGFADVYLTSMGDQKFQTFEGDANSPAYRDATYERGTTAHRPHIGEDGRPSTGWHAAFGDVDNDGRDDIFVAKGNVEQMPDAAMQDPNTLLIQGDDGRFTEMSGPAGVASMAKSRGAVLADLDFDGDLDLAVVNRRTPMELYENVSAGGNWLLVNVAQTGVNPNAIGTHIELCDLAGDHCHTREITIGGGHAGGALGAQHFGLGDWDKAKLRVIWPDQTVSEWLEVAVNQTIAIER
ncbi:ASPIC and UnbV [Pelagimonas phthalicica]|uniref:ASPIC and UnbV n=1 Tax=Pelagimonas phthalicica TaxID=1037362 RepID=A0A238JFD0_9RHOB|nr:CRTAC1 family protein [Pelagimonas phthalicica]TDS92329.1 VCBS repeat protein [Pelagimonas phthalicica]SMX29390.1 ASPIC and UnbV [Pelagimonas phthalicica]